MDVFIIIMAGGFGTRFWPLSRKKRPKQFLPIVSEKSMIEEAIVEINKAVELSGGVPLNIANAVMTHYKFGDKGVAERLFDSLKKRASHEYIQPVCFVHIYLARGETDLAYEWVKKACEERDSFLPWQRITPLDCMQFPTDPRIDELLDRLGLP